DLCDGREPRVRPLPAADLGAGTPVDADHVGGEVVAPPDQHAADPVGVDRRAGLLEGRDALGGEAAGDDDPDALMSGLVQRAADLPDQLRYDAGGPERAHVRPERAVDEA